MARMEVLTVRERRRFWSHEHKLAILGEVADDHLSVSDVARRHDVMPQQIYAWRRKFVREAEAVASPDMATFLPVAVIPRAEPEQSADTGPKASPSSRRSTRVEIRCRGGRVLKVTAGLAPALLQALIRVVETA